MHLVIIMIESDYRKEKHMALRYYLEAIPKEPGNDAVFYIGGYHQHDDGIIVVSLVWDRYKAKKFNYKDNAEIFLEKIVSKDKVLNEEYEIVIKKF